MKKQTLFTTLQEKIQRSSIQQLEITRRTERNVRFQVHMLVAEIKREDGDYILPIQYIQLIEELIIQWLKTEQKNKRLARENRLINKHLVELTNIQKLVEEMNEEEEGEDND